MSQQPYAITVEPDSALQFTITKDPTSDGDANSGSRCVMTLRHPGLTNSHLAFKVCSLYNKRYKIFLVQEADV